MGGAVATEERDVKAFGRWLLAHDDKNEGQRAMDRPTRCIVKADDVGAGEERDSFGMSVPISDEMQTTTEPVVISRCSAHLSGM